MNTKITDIFFDLDHTLWDFEKNSALTFEKILPKNNIHIDTKAFIAAYVPINIEYWKLFRDDRISKQEMRYGRLSDAFATLNLKFDDEILDTLSNDYIQFLPTFNHLHDGAIELLTYLKPKYNLHIITNGFQDLQNYKLDKSNLTPYFKTVTNSESAGVKKPNPIIFEHALQLANADRTSSLMIGDCLDADVKGAMNCGMKAILFNETTQLIEDDRILQVNHLLELKKIL